MDNHTDHTDNHTQKDFWNLESKKENYCQNFLSVAHGNLWLQMLLNIERRKKIKLSGNILEIGGGSQYISRFLSSNRCCSVICTDVSPERIIEFNNFYNENIPNLQTDSVDATRLPYDDNSFDFIIGDACLHHIEDLRSCLLEINRCLKPTGKAIFIREPISGLDNIILKRPLKKIISKLSKKYKKIFEERYKKTILENRYEYGKTYFQWKEEFEFGAFKSSVHTGWYTYNRASILKSLIPFWFTCSVSFYLEKKFVELPSAV